ncbi:MAG: response regulator [Candidatus Competibacter sp.]|nr:response regulator [Candidatus Competibacter sp.]MDG4606803.1 response regulator [Candidatus Contendobacter sp.]HRD49376.1 response regulator [Candidatus Contendobacter sp.]
MSKHAEVEILLVEDNPNDAEFSLRALKKNHLANRLVHVADGEEALDFLFARGAFSHRQAENRPRVVILDLKLPKVDGLEVLRIIKADPRLRVIPVVMLTSSQEERDVIESYRLGVNSFIVKPVDFDKFAAAVRDLGMYWMLLNQSPVA